MNTKIVVLYSILRLRKFTTFMFVLLKSRTSAIAHECEPEKKLIEVSQLFLTKG